MSITRILEELSRDRTVTRERDMQRAGGDVAMAMIEELRQSRARVAELEKCLTDLHMFAGRGDGHETADNVSDCIAGVIIQLRADLERAESAEARVKELEAELTDVRHLLAKAMTDG